MDNIGRIKVKRRVKRTQLVEKRALIQNANMSKALVANKWGNSEGNVDLKDGAAFASRD